MWEKIKAFLFKNQSTKQTVAKNTFWLSVSNFGGRLIKAAVIIYAARVLGTAGYGVFSYAITLASFLTLFMDLGVNGILLRDAAKTDDQEQRVVFGTTFVIKLVLLAIGVCIIAFVAPTFSTLPSATALLPIVIFVLALDTLREFFLSLLRALEKMEWEAVIFILTNIGIVVFGFIFLSHAATPKSFGWGYVAGDSLGIIAALIIIRPYLKNIFFYFSKERVLPIIKAAWPFAISGALGGLFTSADILIISWFRSASDVGIYSAAIRIVQVLYIIPGVMQYATLPLFSRLAKNNDPKFRAALEQTLALVFFASIPLSIGGIILGTPIMSFVFGASYSAGGLSFEILMGTLLFDFTTSIILNALFAYNHQKSLVVSSTLGGVVNVGLDLLLIPPFGIAGSAVATLIAQIVNNGYLWYAMKNVHEFSILPHLKKIAVASVMMGLTTALCALLGVNLIINILISIGIYFLVLRVLREPILIEVKRLLFPAPIS